MRALWQRYAALLAHRGNLRFAVLSLGMRMPLGTLGVAMVLHLRELTGSIAFAGSVVGAQLVATAVTAPVLGRITDRRGPRGVLAVTGLVSPLALLFVLFAGTLGLPKSAIFAAAIMVGAFAPPVTVIVRALWRHRLDGEPALQRTAFALDAALLELAYTAGPLLVALAVAAASAQAALGLAWVFVAAATPLLHVSGGLAWWKSQPDIERHLLGPLRDMQLLRVFGATLALTLAFGALEVGYQGFARAIGRDAWGPTLIAVNSIGSAVGGLAYGGLHLSRPIERQWPLLTLLFAIGVGIHAIVGNPWAMAPCAFAAGLMIAPAMTAVSLLVTKNAPAHYATEAFTWSVTAIITGVGGGMAAGGALIERNGPWAAFAFGAACALSAAILALSLRVPRAAP